jgi:hypothetical protein
MKVLSLCTNVVIMLFVEALLYNVTDPDDGSCHRSSTATECRTHMSSLASNESMCYWEGDIVGDSSSDVSDVSGDCYFRDLRGDSTEVLIVALISAVIGAPIALVMQYIISNVLCKDTIQEEREETIQDIVERKSAGMSAVLDISTVVEDEMQLSRDKADMMTEMSTFRDAVKTVGDTVKLREFDGKCVCM